MDFDDTLHSLIGSVKRHLGGSIVCFSPVCDMTHLYVT